MRKKEQHQIDELIEQISKTREDLDRLEKVFEDYVPVFVRVNEDGGIDFHFWPDEYCSDNQKKAYQAYQALLAGSNLLLTYSETEEGLKQVEEFLEKE